MSISAPSLSSTTQLALTQLAQSIDHTLLKADYREKDIALLCQEAQQYQFKGICIPPAAIPIATEYFRSASTQQASVHLPLIVTVVGFPLGHCLTQAKVADAKAAIQLGANEIDMVIHVSAILDSQWERAEQDIRAVVTACHPIPVKVIIETAYLNPEQKVKAALIAESAGALFVKTSTGFAPDGAKLDDIRMLRKILKTTTKLKASGGIRTLKAAQEFLAEGATRLGTSSGVSLMKELAGEVTITDSAKGY